MDDVRRERPHQGQIMDLQTNKDLTFLISSSKDCTAKVKQKKQNSVSFILMI